MSTPRHKGGAVPTGLLRLKIPCTERLFSRQHRSALVFNRFLQPAHCPPLWYQDCIELAGEKNSTVGNSATGGRSPRGWTENSRCILADSAVAELVDVLD